jgi:Ca2+/Na+ antiporter
VHEHRLVADEYDDVLLSLHLPVLLSLFVMLLLLEFVLGVVVVWVLCMAVYIFFQVLSFRNRHYAVIKHPHRGQDHDPYLPRKKK